MKTGERWIAIAIAGLVLFAVGKAIFSGHPTKKDEEVPFYSTADEATAKAAADLYRGLSCRDCHAIWGVKNVMQLVPAPSLDGIGSLRDEAWLYRYFSAENPQTILPSRLKKQYQHPSYANLPESQRKLLARYFASMKVKDWYLEETRKAEQQKLTGVDSK
ncbi:MAG TPA: cytochrome c [Mariprofundaceae bacterium]|nr:cytochrome c [Mariprofundaceae bacterium]